MKAIHDLQPHRQVLESSDQLAHIRRSLSLQRELVSVVTTLDHQLGATRLFEPETGSQ